MSSEKATTEALPTGTMRWMTKLWGAPAGTTASTYACTWQARPASRGALAQGMAAQSRPQEAGSQAAQKSETGREVTSTPRTVEGTAWGSEARERSKALPPMW